MPYYQKSCAVAPPNTAKREPNATVEFDPDPFLTTGDPLYVSYANYAQTFDNYLQPAFNMVDMLTASDFNSRELDGIQYCSSKIDLANEHRASSLETFLQDAVVRSNLKVYQISMAEKVLFNTKK